MINKTAEIGYSTGNNISYRSFLSHMPQSRSYKYKYHIICTGPRFGYIQKSQSSDELCVLCVLRRNKGLTLPKKPTLPPYARRPGKLWISYHLSRPQEPANVFEVAKPFLVGTWASPPPRICQSLIRTARSRSTLLAPSFCRCLGWNLQRSMGSFSKRTVEGYLQIVHTTITIFSFSSSDSSSSSDANSYQNAENNSDQGCIVAGNIWYLIEEERNCRNCECLQGSKPGCTVPQPGGQDEGSGMASATAWLKVHIVSWRPQPRNLSIVRSSRIRVSWYAKTREHARCHASCLTRGYATRYRWCSSGVQRQVDVLLCMLSSGDHTVYGPFRLTPCMAHVLYCIEVFHSGSAQRLCVLTCYTRIIYVWEFSTSPPEPPPQRGRTNKFYIQFDGDWG